MIHNLLGFIKRFVLLIKRYADRTYRRAKQLSAKIFCGLPQYRKIIHLFNVAILKQPFSGFL